MMCCFSFFSFQNQVLFSSWESIFGDDASKMRENVPIYSFDGRDILRDSAWWVYAKYLQLIFVKKQLILLTHFKICYNELPYQLKSWIQTGAADLSSKMPTTAPQKDPS